MTKKYVSATESGIEVRADIRVLADKAGIDPGCLVGIGEGYTEEEDGYRDFGTCGFCGVGHYIGGPGSLFGECNWCGAV